MRRRFGLGLVVGGTLLALAAGCQNVQGPARLAARHPREGVLGQDVIDGGREAAADQELAEARRQHKPNRLAGGWSDEAAEIEASLGVPR